jgi:hypothetical protein
LFAFPGGVALFATWFSWMMLFDGSWSDWGSSEKGPRGELEISKKNGFAQ